MTLLAFISGAAALSHQIIWTRRFVDVLGADANTFSKVIGAFFLGLALGSALTPRFLPAARIWQRLAAAELLVGLLALPALFSYAITEEVLLRSSSTRLGEALLPIALIAPPAMGMGLVLPLFIMALPPQWTLRLYGINILGGVTGVLVTLLHTLPHFGVTQAGLLAASCNLAVALGIALVARRAEDTPKAGGVLVADSLRFRRLAAVAFISGFAVLACEVILQQQLAQVSINSIFSSGLVLIAVLVSLGAAALLSPLVLRLARNVRVLLTAVIAVSAFLCFLQPFVFALARPGLELLPYELPASQYFLRLLGLAGVCAVPMIFAAGLLFPLTLHAACRGRLAALLAVNGFGGWLGAELTQAWILPRSGLWLSICVIGAVYFVLLLWVQGKVSSPVSVAGVAVCVIAVSYARGLPQVGVRASERVLAVASGREGVVATVERGAADRRMLFNNSYSLGGSKAQVNQERQALLPLLLHPNPRAVACLGVATGSTVAGAALHPGVQHVDAIELSPLVLGQAQAFFTAFNRRVFENPRVEFIQEDARWIVASRQAAYDVVLGDLFLPWRTGEGRLFTLEHFERVRASLKPGGLFCQWLPMFQLTRPQFEMIVATFQKVFPEAWVLRGDFYSELPILGLLGGADLKAFDRERIAETCRRLRDRGQVSDPLMRHPEGVAMMIVGPVPKSTAPLNTLENSALEWNAARNVIGLRDPWFVGVPCAEYIRDIHRRGRTLLPDAIQRAHDAGQFFLTIEIAARLQLPALAGLQAQIPERMPPAMWRDADANWQTWPMRIKPNPSQ